MAKKEASRGPPAPFVYELRSVNLSNLPEKEQGAVLDRFASFLDSLTEPITFHIVQDEREVGAVGALYQIPYKRFFVQTPSQADSLILKLGTRMTRVHAIPSIKMTTVNPKYIVDSDGRYVQTYCITRLGGALVPGFLAELYPVAYSIMVDVEPIDIYEAKRIVRSYAKSLGSRLVLRQTEGRSLDPEEQAEFQRASGAAQLIGMGREKLFRTRISIVLRTNTYEELVEARKKLKQLVGGMLGQIDSPAYLQEPLLTGWGPKYATGNWFYMTTSAALSLFPFCGLDVVDPSGVFLGQNLQTSNAVIYDVFEKENYNVALMGMSLAYDEPLVYRENGRIKIGKIGEVIDKYYDGDYQGPVPTSSFEVISFDPRTLEIDWTPIQYVYRHEYSQKMLKVTLRTGRTVVVTPGHSLIVLREGAVTDSPASEIKKGDTVICARTIPGIEPRVVDQNIDLVGELGEAHGFRLYDVPPDVFSRVASRVPRGKLVFWKRIRQLPLEYAGYLTAEELDVTKLGYKHGRRYPRLLPFDDAFARLLGYYAAEGHLQHKVGKSYHLVFTLDRVNDLLIRDDIIGILRSKFGVNCGVYEHGSGGLRLVCNSKVLVTLIKEWMGTGAAEKRVPELLLNEVQV